MANRRADRWQSGGGIRVGDRSCALVICADRWWEIYTVGDEPGPPGPPLSVAVGLGASEHDERSRAGNLESALTPSRAVTTDWRANTSPLNTPSTSNTKRSGSAELFGSPVGVMTSISEPVKTASAFSNAWLSVNAAQLHAATRSEVPNTNVATPRAA